MRPPSALLLTCSLAAALVAPPASAKPDATAACIAASDEGQVLRDQGKLNAARERFVACSRDACPRLLRTDCAGWLADVEARIPTVVLSAQDPEGHDLADVNVTLDGAPFVARLDGLAMKVDPGEHRFRFERPGSPPVEQVVIVREGDRRRAVAARFPAPAAAPIPLPPSPSGPSNGVIAAAVVLGGVTVAGGGLFAYFASSAKRDADHLRATCAPTCKQSDVDAVRTKEIIANSALGTGIAAAAAGTLLLVLGPKQGPTVKVAFSSTDIAVVVGGKF